MVQGLEDWDGVAQPPTGKYYSSTTEHCLDFQTKDFQVHETVVYTLRPVSGKAVANTGSTQQFSLLTDQAIQNFINISFTNAQANDTYDVVCPTVQNAGRNTNIIWDYATVKTKRTDTDVNLLLVEIGYENLTPQRQCSNIGDDDYMEI